MKAISSAFSEKGGYSAQFVSDGYTIDARKEILPGIIKANGVQVGEGVAWDLIQAFLKECVARAAATGIKFVFQDKMDGEHELEVGEHIEIAKSDTKLVINDTMIVETMRTICTDYESELNTGSGAAVKVTLTDGTELYHAVAFG